MFWFGADVVRGWAGIVRQVALRRRNVAVIGPRDVDDGGRAVPEGVERFVGGRRRVPEVALGDAERVIGHPRWSGDLVRAPGSSFTCTAELGHRDKVMEASPHVHHVVSAKRHAAVEECGLDHR
jgi:hypothetical protein